jgi:hypothetical protein
MFRETARAKIDVHYDEHVWPVLSRENAFPRLVEITADEASELPPSLPFRSAAAAPDVPAAVGILLFACYLALIGALAIATAGPGESKFALVIAALFVVAFFSVPRLILAQEPIDGARVTMDHFLTRGIETFTGHCSGRAALVQMFVVPVLLTLGVLSIAIIIAVVG